MSKGDDQRQDSGRLVFRTPKETQDFSDGFLFENTDQDGFGPESLLNFVDACLGKEYHNCASSAVGLRTVEVVEAMYRSSASGKLVKI